MTNIQRGSGEISVEAWKKVLLNLSEFIIQIKFNGLKITSITFGRGLVDRLREDKAFLTNHIKDDLKSPETVLLESMDYSLMNLFRDTLSILGRQDP